MDLKKLLHISRTDKQLAERLEIAEMFARVLSETATEKEKLKLEKWVEQASDRTEELKRIRIELRDQAMESPDMEKMWKEFQSRLSHQRGWGKSVLRYAAILVFPLCIAAWMYFEFRTVAPAPVTEFSANVTPGKYKARLILGDGRKVNITKETEINIQDKSGVRISSSGNILQYNVPVDSAVQNVSPYNTLTVPVGGEFTIQLSDGTKVWLNAGSKLKYPVVFQGDQRKVEMEGEGYFEVKKNEQMPFIVQVNDISVRVLGTAFNVSSYHRQTVTTLISGKVCLMKGEQRVVLQPGEQAIAVAETPGFDIRKVNARNYALWKNGIFWFENEDLNTILENLARWYDVEIFYADPELKKLRFSVEMKRYESIETVLRKIEYTRKVRFMLRDRTVCVGK